MTIIDDFKSEQNRNIIFQASNKMLLDKYKLSLNNVVLTNIINAIISSMSKKTNGIEYYNLSKNERLCYKKH